MRAERLGAEDYEFRELLSFRKWTKQSRDNRTPHQPRRQKHRRHASRRAHHRHDAWGRRVGESGWRAESCEKRGSAGGVEEGEFGGKSGDAGDELRWGGDGPVRGFKGVDRWI